MKHLVVIGGVAAGLSAATKAKRINPHLKISVYEKGNDISYGACGIPYFISGKDISFKPLIAKPMSHFQQQGIDIFTFHNVISIDPKNKEITVENSQTNETKKVSYDTLVIATGAKPFIPPIKGAHLDGVFALRTLEQGKDINTYLVNNSVKKAIIVGGGYIGLEMAESLTKAGIVVTIIEVKPRILPNFYDEIVSFVKEELANNNVELYESTTIISFEEEKNKIKTVKTDKGDFETDVVLFATGIRPEVELAKKAGIKLGESGAIYVDKLMQTNVPDIYAAGDCAEAYHNVLKKNVYMPLGSTANKQGRIAGINLAGGHFEFQGILSTSAFKVFSLTVAQTGINEQEALELNIKPIKVVTKTSSQPHYYPKNNPITTVVIGEEISGRILGSQMVGKTGVSKRIDVFATCIYNEMTAKEVGFMDFSYAPPFSPVWDPVAVTANLLEKKASSKKK